MSWQSQEAGVWVLLNDQDRVCAKGAMVAGQNTQIFPKIANGDGLRLVLSPNLGQESREEIPARPNLSQLAKPAGSSVIYQLPIRPYFARGMGRDLTGRLDDLTDAFLNDLRNFGVDYIWLTGVLEHADLLQTDPDVVKGNAGSYYAVYDNWDVATEIGGLPSFSAAIERAHRAGIRVLIDFVPNHTARMHRTDVTCREDMNFGRSDRKDQFFLRDNNYYYITNPNPSVFLPPPQPGVSGADGKFDIDVRTPGIQFESPAKVTGNDILSANPVIGDWFETVKLNYGFDLQRRLGVYSPRPKTWDVMVDVAEYWLNKGVDGFRVDFAHAVPIEFWRYFARQVRQVQPNAFLLAEAYESDEYMKLPGFSYEALLDAGFDTLFNSDLYQKLAKQARNPGDVRPASPTAMPAMRNEMLQKGYLFTQFLENHDEIRVASGEFSPRIGDRAMRAKLGLAYSIFSALLPGHFSIHGGQEVEEDASVVGPFAGNNARTSIFDFVYEERTRDWLQGRSPASARALRETYKSLLRLKHEPAFVAGNSTRGRTYYDLNSVNRYGDQGLWVMSYVRQFGDQAWLVVLNSDPFNSHTATVHFTDVDNRDPTGVLSAMGVQNDNNRFVFEEVLSRPGFIPTDPAIPDPGIPGWALYRQGNIPSGLYLGQIPPGTTWVFRMGRL